MKKITLLILFGFLFSWANYGQVPIGTQDGTTSNYPITSCDNFSYSQQIVLQEEINAVPGDITSISFYYDNSTASSTANSSDWTIYMGHTTRDRFPSNSSWIASTNLSEVYSGTVTFPAQGNMMEITFDTPFPYNNVNNLVIAVDENAEGSNCTLYFGKTGALGAPRGIYFKSDTVNPDPDSPPNASGRATYINNIILGGIQESCPAPSDLVADSVSDTTAEVSWTENGSATEWEVIYGPAGFNPATGGTTLNVSGTPDASITGLSATTRYEFYVRAICGVGDESALVGPKAFRTSCGIITTLPYLENFDTYGTGSDAFPPCWERPVVYTSGSSTWPSIVNGNATSAPNSLKFQSQVGTPTYAVSPAFGEDIHNLRVSFKLKREGTSSGTMDIGVMSNPNDISTFELVETISPSDNNYHEYIYNLTQTELSGPNNHIALRQNSNSGVWYYWLDDFKVQLVPSCIEPSNLLVGTVTDTTADLSWTEAATATQWEVIYGPAGFNPETEGTTLEVNGTPEVTLTGLTSDTAYEFYVRAICSDDDESLLAGPKYFFTGYCEFTSTTSSRYINNFSTQNAILNISNLNSGLSPNGYGNFTDQMVMSFPTGSFDFEAEFADGTYGFNIWIDFNGNMEFEESEKVYASGAYGNSATGTVEIPATVASGEYRMRIVADYLSTNPNACGANNNAEAEDYTVSIGPPPSCMPVTDLAASNIGETSADLSWTSQNTVSETEWVVIYGQSGFNPETEGTTVEVSGTPETTITGLGSDTLYDFYVRAICSDDDESALAGPHRFRTACGIISVLPYIEDFDTYGTGSDAFPPCWERVTYTSGTTWPSIVSANATSAPNSLKFQSATDTPTYAISPAFAEDINNLRVSFMLKREGTSSGTMELGVMSDANDISTFELVETINPSDNDYHEYIFNLTQTTLSGPNNYIALRQNSNSSVWYYWLDDFKVNLVPTCLEPTDLAVGVISETTAEISWTEAADATQWEVIYGPAGFNPETQGTTIVVNGDPETTLTGLTSDAAYEFYVRAICSDDDESYWTGPKYFFTGYCEFSSTSTDRYINNFSTEEGIQNISNMNSGQSPNGYGNFTEMAVVSFPTGSFDFEAGFADGTYGFNIWIDFNGNMEFEDSEKVYASGTYVSSASGTITIPLTVPNGDYRMRIVANYLSTNPNSCGSNTNSEAEDYTVTIINAPTCFPVRDLVVEGVGEDFANISWTPQNTETEWDVIYGAPGFDPETEGTVVHVDGGVPEATLTGLEPSTEYEFYVRAICEVDDESMLTGPSVFMTECVSVYLPYTLDFENVSPPALPTCSSVQTIGNSNDWETAYVTDYGFTGRVLRYKWNSIHSANSWFFTEGVNLEAGTEYKIAYKYGNTGNGLNEKMEVKFGTAPSAASMTESLADYPEITGGMATNEMIEFTVAEDGVYYFGFHAYSPADRFYLFVDDIEINFANECAAVTDLAVSNVTNTSVTVTWTGNDSATSYTVDVFMEGADPAVDTPEASETVAGDQTTATIEGLSRDTAYKVYVTSDCGGGNITQGEGIGFVTTELGVSGNDYTMINYFPNPVKDKLTITAADPIENVTVYNLLGQKVLEVKSNGMEVEIDMSEISSGTYLLKTNVAKGISTFKILKQ